MATKPFSMKEVYDGVFEETDDKLTISNRDFGDKNLSQIIEKCVENEPALKNIVFIECSFNKVIFDGSTIDRKLLFKECSFYGEVLFQNCNFQRELGFFIRKPFLIIAVMMIVLLDLTKSKQDPVVITLLYLTLNISKNLTHQIML